MLDICCWRHIEERNRLGSCLFFSLFFSLFFTLLIKRTSTSEGFLCRFGGRSADPTALSAAAAPWVHGEPSLGLLGLSQGDALSLPPLAAPDLCLVHSTGRAKQLFLQGYFGLAYFR